MRIVRVGVAGVGHWARTAHLPAIASHQRARLVAIADPDVANRERSGRAYGVPGFRDPQEMIEACDLDALVVATPHESHYRIGAAAIAGGLNVLIEKPLVLEPTDGSRLIRAAIQTGVEVVVGYPWHFNSQALQARAWIAEGRLGPIHYVQSFFGSSPINLYRGMPEVEVESYGAGEAFDGPLQGTYADPLLSGGGQGQTQLTHSIALLLFMTGLEPTRVAAFMDRQATAVDVVDALSVRFRGGAIGTIGSTGAVTPRSHTDTLEFIIHGSAGHLHFDVSEGSLKLFDRRGLTEVAELPPPDRYPVMAPAHNLIDVTLRLAQNGSPPLVAQRAVTLLHAAYRSAEQDGSAIDVPTE